eukprot:1155993-Pelagomonas_calceolata.AAC.4
MPAHGRLAHKQDALGGVEAQQLGHAVAVGGVLHDAQLHRTAVVLPELAVHLAGLAGGSRLILICGHHGPTQASAQDLK